MSSSMSSGSDPTRPQQESRSLGELFGNLTEQTRNLLRQEIELAKVEIKQEATRAGKASGKLVAGGAIGFVAFLLLSWAIAWAIDLVWPRWAAFGIVGLVYAIVAAVLAQAGRKQLQDVNLPPPQTVDEVKETKEWVSNQP
jgi:uncharacterized membrane protein YqjE